MHFISAISLLSPFSLNRGSWLLKDVPARLLALFSSFFFEPWFSIHCMKSSVSTNRRSMCILIRQFKNGLHVFLPQQWCLCAQIRKRSNFCICWLLLWECSGNNCGWEWMDDSVVGENSLCAICTKGNMAACVVWSWLCGRRRLQHGYVNGREMQCSGGASHL